MKRLLLALYLAFAQTLAAVGDEAAPGSFGFDRYIIGPLHIHLLVSTTEPALCTTLTDSDLERIIAKVNRVWSHAGIAFFVEKITREEPEPLAPDAEPPRRDHRSVFSRVPRATHVGELFHVYYIKDFAVNGVCFPTAIFVKDAASLRPVEGGIDEPIPRVTSHELGHALGLPHRQDRTNLMASGTTGTSLDSFEVERARETALKGGWFISAQELVAKADALAASGDVSAAYARYKALADLPAPPELARKLREQLGK